MFVLLKVYSGHWRACKLHVRFLLFHSTHQVYMSALDCPFRTSGLLPPATTSWRRAVRLNARPMLVVSCFSHEIPDAQTTVYGVDRS
eukprot:751498-Hanusia_phi.AAC.7